MRWQSGLFALGGQVKKFETTPTVFLVLLSGAVGIVVGYPLRGAAGAIVGVFIGGAAGIACGRVLSLMGPRAWLIIAGGEGVLILALLFWKFWTV